MHNLRKCGVDQAYGRKHGGQTSHPEFSSYLFTCMFPWCRNMCIYSFCIHVCHANALVVHRVVWNLSRHVVLINVLVFIFAIVVTYLFWLLIVCLPVLFASTCFSSTFSFTATYIRCRDAYFVFVLLLAPCWLSFFLSLWIALSHLGFLILRTWIVCRSFVSFLTLCEISAFLSFLSRLFISFPLYLSVCFSVFFSYAPFLTFTHYFSTRLTSWVRIPFEAQV